MMKKVLLILLMLLPLLAVAQTKQQGVVKTRGRIVNGRLQRGEGLAGAIVKVAGRQPVMSQGAKGYFSFPVMGESYRVEKVTKQGYQLLNPDDCRSYAFSRDTLSLVMETPEQQQADLVAAERKIRRNLQHQLEQKEDEIERLHDVTRQQKDSLLRLLYQQQTDNERLISDMAKRFATLDYDQLDDYYREVSCLIEDGLLTRADSMLRSRGDVQAQVATQLHRGKAIEEQAKKTDMATLTNVFSKVVEEIYTSIDSKDLLELVTNINNYRIVDEGGFPEESMRTTGNIGAKGSCVIPLDLESNVVWLHKFLFNLDSYTVSDTVKECSAKVKSDTSKYVNR